MNCEAYSSFDGVSSDHRIVTVKNTTEPTKEYDPNNNHSTGPCLIKDFRERYALTLRNKFDALQKTERHTSNDEYENFVNAHLEAAAECIPTKQRAEPRVLWETLAVRKKRADVKTASKCNRKNPTNTNVLKLKKPKTN